MGWWTLEALVRKTERYANISAMHSSPTSSVSEYMDNLEKEHGLEDGLIDEEGRSLLDPNISADERQKMRYPRTHILTLYAFNTLLLLAVIVLSWQLLSQRRDPSLGVWCKSPYFIRVFAYVDLSQRLPMVLWNT